MSTRYQLGDRVVYTRDQYSTYPSQNAKNVRADRHGELYQFQVDKYWIVVRVLSSEQIEVRSCSGNLHQLQTEDPRLRKASLWERVFLAQKFPNLKTAY